MKRLLEFFEEPKIDGLSSTRLIFILWGVGVLFTWMYSSIATKTLQPIDNSIIVAFGVIVTGKVVQRGIENQ